LFVVSLSSPSLSRALGRQGIGTLTKGSPFSLGYLSSFRSPLRSRSLSLNRDQRPFSLFLRRFALARSPLSLSRCSRQGPRHMTEPLSASLSSFRSLTLPLSLSCVAGRQGHRRRWCIYIYKLSLADSSLNI
jgi:hypothetical protein